MKALRYDQVYLVPRYSELRSRSEADISVEFLGRKFAAPIIPANMQSVINEDIAHWLSENNYPYIYHRFSDTLAFVERANRDNWKLISISVGVKEQDRELLRKIVAKNLRVDWICVDIAHGDSVLMKEMIEFIKSGMYNLVFEAPVIIAGNVATPEAVMRLSHWGADCVKVGIAGGAACSTKVNTGFHVPMFTCVQECYWKGGGTEWTLHTPPRKVSSKIPLIFDGGIREPGDIAKALVAGRGGRNLVMAGSIFAACVDAPGESIYETIFEGPKPDGSNVTYGRSFYTKRLTKKRFHGSASAKQKGERKHVEGFEVELPCNGLTYAEKYQELRESLQSAVSYGGGKDLSCFKDVEWVEV